MVLYINKISDEFDNWQNPLIFARVMGLGNRKNGQFWLVFTITRANMNGFG